MRRMKKQFSTLLKDYPVIAALFLMKCLVRLPLPVWQKFGIALGKLVYLVAKKRRHIVEVNLKMAFPDKTEAERDKMTRAVIINTVLGALESFYSWWADDADIRARSTIKDLDILLDANKGQGVIIIGAHYSTLDLSGRVMGLFKKVDIVYKKQSNKVFNQTMIDCRSPYYSGMIEKKDMRSMIKRLKEGHIVWYAPDQDFGRKGAVFAPFFGVETATLANIGKLVKLTGAKVVFFSHFREGLGEDTRFVGAVTAPFGDDVSTDDEMNARTVNHALEQSLRENDITQYFWVHKRFKTRPDPTEPNPYN